MTENKRRLRFAAVLTVAATLYASLLAYRLLPAQSDLLSDIFKLSGIAFLGTAGLSYFWWTVIMHKMKGALGGMLAGLLSAICVIPLPTFLGGLKSSLSTNSDIIHGVMGAMRYSLSTLSLAEFIALPLCAAAGYILAK